MGKINLEHIEIKVEKDRAKYFLSLPLHHTQQEKERTEDYTIFTYDVEQSLLTISKERKLMDTNVGLAPQTRFYNVGVKATF